MTKYIPFIALAVLLGGCAPNRYRIEKRIELTEGGVRETNIYLVDQIENEWFQIHHSEIKWRKFND